MTLTTAILAKNEAAPDRYLARVLQNALSFSDKVLLLDDSSTDNTRELALALGVSVSKRAKGEVAWGHEGSARAELWAWGAREARDGWLLIQDADMILHGDPRPLAASWDAAAWSFVLFDCWDSEQQARVDRWWAGGPQTPRPWLFRPNAMNGSKPEFNNRGIHVGHMPANWVGTCFPAPFPQYYWLHLAYVKHEHRIEKHKRYMNVQNQLSTFEYEHANSILDQTSLCEVQTNQTT